MLSRTHASWFNALAAGLTLAVLTASLFVVDGPLPGSGHARAQDATPGQEEYAEPTAVATEAAPPVATEPPPVEPPAEEATNPSPPETDAPPETPASAEPGAVEHAPAGDSEQGDPSTPVATPRLAFDAIPAVTCQTATDAAQVEHGGWIEYICAASVELSAENLPSLDAELAWVFQADAPGEWRVRFAPLSEETEWTPATQSAEIGLLSAFARDRDEGNWRSRAELGFRMGIHRARCDGAPGSIALRGHVGISSPGNDAIVFAPDASEREPLRIAAPLVPIPLPAATFDGPVSFDPIGVTSVDEAVAGGSATVIVSGLDRACGEWRLDLQAGSERPGASFWLVSVNGVALGEACSLADGCVIDLVAGDVDQPGEAVYTIGLHLIVSSGVPPGALPVSFNVALVPA